MQENTVNKQAFILLISFSTATLFAPEFSSQSFMFTHPLNMNVGIEQAVWHRIAYYKQNPKNIAGQMISIYQPSIDSQQTTQYFLPPNRNTLLVAGDSAPQACDRDVRAEWLGIDNPFFRGYLSLNPIQKQIGLFFEYNQNIDHLIHSEFAKNLWVNVSAPIVLISNDLNLSQVNVKSHPSTGPADIITAFNQPAWRYAKMLAHPQTRMGLAEVSCTIGRTYVADNNFEAVFYAGVTIPTSSSQNAEFIFDPFLAYNGHCGVKTGVNIQAVTNQENEHMHACLFLNLQSIVFIKNEQMRTFDLKDKPWSRYLLFNTIDGPPDQNIPGVNILTQLVQVRPFTFMNLAAGIRVVSPHNEITIAYGLWGHGNERVSLVNEFPEKFGIAGVGERNPGSACIKGASASMSTIAQQAANDLDAQGNPIFIPITMEDLDFDSAISRSTLVHQMHGSWLWLCRGNYLDCIIGIGAYYELPLWNSALTQWGSWVKVGSTF